NRISHLIATALVEFLREKHGISEALDFRIEAKNAAFTRAYKRQAVSRITALAEACKAELSSAPRDHAWTLAPEQELELLRCFDPLLVAGNAAAPGPNGTSGAPSSAAALEERVQRGPRLTISLATLTRWVKADRQSMATNGEPGLMDVFLYLQE